MAPLTMFQKACTAVATAGGAGAAVFGYAVKRHVEDAEFRVWLRETSPMAAKQVDEFMADYMPQTVRVQHNMHPHVRASVHRAPAHYYNTPLIWL